MLRAETVDIAIELDKLHEHRVAAKDAGLRYINSGSAGFTRRKSGSGFSYLDASGKPLKDAKHLSRIRSLVIPPAWTEVWICPFANGHLQATGYDVRRRKQYRYHTDWHAARSETKFTKMLLFAEKLPLIRRRVAADLKKPGMKRERVLAAIVAIMERTMIRIGNDEYAEKNSSYGLTTIRNHHAKVRGASVSFKFKGKSGKLHDVEIEDKGLAEIVRKCQELPGQELFAFKDDEGTVSDVTSSDVNDYLREITGEDITAKDFRTWGGTVQAALVLQGFGPCESKKELKKIVSRAVEHTAQRLRNTPAVCRKYYIHPCVLSAYENGKLFKIYASCRKAHVKNRVRGLYPDERFALQLLQSSLLDS